jgi:glutamine phosphoribosylpyrophosphate amidotransferase
MERLKLKQKILLVAVRYPFRFMPLVMGTRFNGAVIFVSKTCALHLIEAGRSD